MPEHAFYPLSLTAGRRGVAVDAVWYGALCGDASRNASPGTAGVARRERDAAGAGVDLQPGDKVELSITRGRGFHLTLATHNGPRHRVLPAE
jgi:hypothetical protein